MSRKAFFQEGEKVNQSLFPFFVFFFLFIGNYNLNPTKMAQNPKKTLLDIHKESPSKFSPGAGYAPVNVFGDEFGVGFIPDKKLGESDFVAVRSNGQSGKSKYAR